jgi:ribokinase
VIAVLGSANMDIVTEVARMPRPGETVLGTNVHRFLGGKGANQAIAAARLGETVVFFGKVGADLFGEELLESLEDNGVCARDVEKAENQSSGVACILVEESGENAISYVPGANALVDSEYVSRIYNRLVKADVVLLQFEIPMETIAYLLDRLPPRRPMVIVDPAPARDISGLPLHRVDLLTPNRGELAVLSGMKDIDSGARLLLERGIRRLVCKAGGDGAYVFAEKTTHILAPKVAAVDTTAAGDAFNAALACAITGTSLLDAIRWANAAGALTTTRRGAQPSLPTREEVDRLFDEPTASVR